MNHGLSDIWVVKLDGTGKRIQWQRLLGGAGTEEGSSVQQTSDGGYILLGTSMLSSASGDVTGTNHGEHDYWVVKLDGSGTIQWQKLLGGSKDDYGTSIRQTSDGGYILFGTSYSSETGDVTGTNHLDGDYWVVKLDGAGTIQWQKLLGDYVAANGYSVGQTTDGGFILFGGSFPVGATNKDGIDQTNDPFDYWVVKLRGTTPIGAGAGSQGKPPASGQTLVHNTNGAQLTPTAGHPLPLTLVVAIIVGAITLAYGRKQKKT